MDARDGARCSMECSMRTWFARSGALARIQTQYPAVTAGRAWDPNSIVAVVSQRTNLLRIACGAIATHGEVPRPGLDGLYGLLRAVYRGATTRELCGTRRGGGRTIVTRTTRATTVWIVFAPYVAVATCSARVPDSADAVVTLSGQSEAVTQCYETILSETPAGTDICAGRL